MKAPEEAIVPEPPNGQTWPKISIVTPSFNQGVYLEKTIRSVLLQGYPNLEYIIIDGGSTDQSVDIIKKYESLIDFWVSEKDRGQSHAINKGLKKATGELFGWLNSDDYYLPGVLFKFAKAYLESPSSGAFYGQGHKVDVNGNIIYTPVLKTINYENLFKWCEDYNFMQPSCLFTKNSWINCGPLDENIHIALDVDFWIRIAKHYPFVKIDESLSFATTHPNAKTTALKNQMYADLAVVYAKHGELDAARRLLNGLTNQLTECQAQLKHIRKFHFILAPIGRILRFLKVIKT